MGGQGGAEACVLTFVEQEEVFRVHLQHQLELVWLEIKGSYH